MNLKLKQNLIANVVFILMLFVIGFPSITYSQQQDDQAYRQKRLQEIQKFQENAPIADFNLPLPDNTEERLKRIRKNRARNLKSQNPEDAKRFMLTEQRESSYGFTPNHLSVQSAIPAKQSDAIIIGEIINGAAYLSEDKVSIYSEFTVKNLVVLKNITPESISAEKPITVSRGGGGVRFPSGKVIYILNTDKPMPQSGKRYLFFLKYSDDVGFSIITAYELLQKKVFPLDGLMLNGNIVRQYAGHQSFRGTSETEFLNTVKEAVANDLDLFAGGK